MLDLKQIKDYTDAGRIVHWSNASYTVIKAKNGEYLIKCASNNHCIGLTWADGVTLNGKEIDFYVEPENVELKVTKQIYKPECCANPGGRWLGEVRVNGWLHGYTRKDTEQEVQAWLDTINPTEFGVSENVVPNYLSMFQRWANK